jgi:hypothetical protein
VFLQVQPIFGILTIRQIRGARLTKPALEEHTFVAGFTLCSLVFGVLPTPNRPSFGKPRGGILWPVPKAFVPAARGVSS